MELSSINRIKSSIKRRFCPLWHPIGLLNWYILLSLATPNAHFWCHQPVDCATSDNLVVNLTTLSVIVAQAKSTTNRQKTPQSRNMAILHLFWPFHSVCSDRFAVYLLRGRQSLTRRLSQQGTMGVTWFSIMTKQLCVLWRHKTIGTDVTSQDNGSKLQCATWNKSATKTQQSHNKSATHLFWPFHTR